MNPHHHTAIRSGHRNRDPLQIPVSLSFDEERTPRILEVTRDLALWLGVVSGAALAIFFVGASVPELKAAAHKPAAQAVVHTASAVQCAADH
ncbi:MAG: hypothetical protein JNK68_04005 [Betaproteobacteria bacterium]|nr:hypothetical protein [Betaproteobacteria bacterium]